MVYKPMRKTSNVCRTVQRAADGVIAVRKQTRMDFRGRTERPFRIAERASSFRRGALPLFAALCIIVHIQSGSFPDSGGTADIIFVIFAPDAVYHCGVRGVFVLEEK